MRAKACSWCHDDAGFFHQFHTERHAVCASSRDSCPDEHRSLAIWKVPADLAETIAECIPSLLIHLALLLNAFKRSFECRDRCFLDRKEHSEIDLTSEFAKCRDHIRAAYEKADPCTCYIKGLGKAEEFYANLLCSFCCKETSTMCSVKDDVAVCIVMDDQNVIFLRKCYNFFVKSRCGNASYRVGWQRNYHVFGFACYFLRDILYIWKKIVLCDERIVVWLCSCHQAACGKYRITWVWKKDNISLIAECHSKMSHSFLAAVNGHDHVRCQLYVKTFLIIVTDCFQKFRKIPETVFPVIVIHGRLCQSFLDVFRCFEVRRSHTHIINFHALCFQFHTSVIQGCKDFFSKSV